VLGLDRDDGRRSSCQYWLFDGITHDVRGSAITARPIVAGVRRVGTTVMPGCPRSSPSMIRPCALSAPAVVAVKR